MYDSIALFREEIQSLKYYVNSLGHTKYTLMDDTPLIVVAFREVIVGLKKNGRFTRHTNNFWVLLNETNDKQWHLPVGVAQHECLRLSHDNMK